MMKPEQAARAKQPIEVSAEPGGADGHAAVTGGAGIQTYAQATRFLFDRVNVEQLRPSRVEEGVFKLDRMRLLMGALGHPERAVQMVHVAGSKGKGSVCEMTASCLAAAGYTVGLYTSPHLVDVRERIRINGRMITQAEFTRVMDRVAAAVARTPADLGPTTYFEVLTALAFLYFSEQAVDVGVIEVGLGGRLDSTNIITPEVTAITSISLEHTQFLGKTLGAIAREKAGIFKAGVPGLTIPQPPEVIGVLREVAQEAGAPLHVVGEDIEFTTRFQAGGAAPAAAGGGVGRAGVAGPRMVVGLATDRTLYEHIVVPFKGEHQAYNCGLSLAILDRLAERGFRVPEAAVVAGLAGADTSGRMEMAWESPRILLDGAHTAESLSALFRAIGAHIPCDSVVVIFGCAADKDLDALLREINLGADKVIFTRLDNPRSADPNELHTRFADLSSKMSQVAGTFEEALAIALRAVQRDDLIVVTGSFYLVGEAKKRLAGPNRK